MNKLNLVVVAAVLLLTVQVSTAQDDWHTYPFRDLETFVAGEQSLYNNSGKPDMAISARPFPAKTRVIFTGKRRNLSQYGKQFIGLWAQSLNRPPEVVDQLLEEFLFIEKGKEYWMPVIRNTAQAIGQNGKPGEEVVIYYFYLGGYDPVRLKSKDSSPTKPDKVESDSFRWLMPVERVERPNTVFQIKRLDAAIPKVLDQAIASNKMWLDARQVKSKSKLVFTGKFRDVGGKQRELRDKWLEQIGALRAALLMETEGLFREDDKEYWIVLRNQTRDHLKEYVKPGDSIYLNSILIGAVQNKNSVDWVFSAGEYSTF